MGVDLAVNDPSMLMTPHELKQKIIGNLYSAFDDFETVFFFLFVSVECSQWQNNTLINIPIHAICKC